MGDLLPRANGPSLGKPAFWQPLGTSRWEKQPGCLRGLQVAVLNREGEVCLYFANNMHIFALSLWGAYVVRFFFHFMDFTTWMKLIVACVVFIVFHATDVWEETGKREERDCLWTRRAISILLMLWEGHLCHFGYAVAEERYQDSLKIACSRNAVYSFKKQLLLFGPLNFQGLELQQLRKQKLHSVSQETWMNKFDFPLKCNLSLIYFPRPSERHKNMNFIEAKGNRH